MNYIPFLKLKQNEVLAIRRLKNENKVKIIPFFDLPRSQHNGVDDFKIKVANGLKYIQSAYKEQAFPFYLDVYDIPDNIKPDGKHIYEYVLDKFHKYDVVPVVGLDRDEEHIEAVLNFIQNRSNKHIAIRLLRDDIDSYILTQSDIINTLGDLLNKSNSFDIIIDMRLIKNEIHTLSRMIIDFIKEYIKNNHPNKIIIASSSTPANIAELIDTQSSKIYSRLEWNLWDEILSMEGSMGDNLVYADYTVISPDYSETEMPVELLQSVMTPKAIYTSKDIAFITRGGRMKSEGYGQYYQIADEIVSLDIFRNPSFCYGDDYIYKISTRECKTCGSPKSWIAATVNCHISHILEL